MERAQLMSDFLLGSFRKKTVATVVQIDFVTSCQENPGKIFVSGQFSLWRP